jgi:hypothetical protein
MDFLAPLLTNPVSAGIIVQMVKNTLKGVFKGIDDKGTVQEHKGWLEPTLLVLTVLTSAIGLALQGHLADMNLDSLFIWFQSLLTQYMISKGTGTVMTTQAVTTVVNKVAGK